LDVASGESLLRFAFEPPNDLRGGFGECVLALTPDGNFVAARFRSHPFPEGSAAYGPVHVGDLATGRKLFELAVDGPAVFTFSADNRLLAVADRDGVRLCEVASGRDIGRLPVRDSEPPANDRPCAAALAVAPDGRTLATGHADSTILFWDATLGGGTPRGPLTASEAEALWADLRGADARKAYAAVWRLAGDPARVVPLVEARIRPVEPPPAAETRRLIDALDGDDFATRQRAERALQDLGERADGVLREAVRGGAPVETRRRIENLLKRWAGIRLLDGEPLRVVRAVQVLERAGTAEAGAVLDAWAKGVPNALLTRESRAALARLRSGRHRPANP
jgi:hypothetical protein